MTESKDDRADRLAESWLRANSPQPDEEFVRSLEVRLFPPRRERAAQRRPRPALLGAAAAACAAAAVLVLSLAGVGPIGSSGDSGQATSNCRFVTVVRTVKVPVVVEHSGGQATIEYRAKRVHQRVKRCR